MAGSMSPNSANRPRIGVPWRTSDEERAEHWSKIENYLTAVARAGGEGVLLSLGDPEALERQIQGLDGFVLPGSPADVEPGEYGAVNRGKSEPADLPRERTDKAILSHAFQAHKPVLAICYGCQLLNVYLGGTLVQDVRTETGTQIAHRKKDLTPEPTDDPRHEVSFMAGSRLARMAGAREAVVNSSHHQSIAVPGRQLRITGQTGDGIVESVEWTGDANWAIGVQWHPERMQGDALAEKLFQELVTAAKGAQKTSAVKG